MCGIYGIQEAPNKELSLYETTVITHTLAKEMESRGRDSFGAITFPDGNLYKGLGRVSDTAVKLLKAASQAKSYLAHTRAATVGDVTVENSHPFAVDDVVGVHNGSIYNYKELNEKYKRECKVDSEHIFFHLNEGLPLPEIEGHGTFFWSRYSEQFSKIYFGKTTSGSLSVVRIYRGDPKSEEDPVGIVWCSEMFAIRKALKILGLEFEEVSIDSGKIYFIQSGEVFATKLPFDITSTWINRNTTNYNNYIVNRQYGISSAFTTDDDETTDTTSDFIKYYSNTKNDADDEDKNVFVEDGPIVRGLTVLLEGRNLSKKERKSIRRRLCFYRQKTRNIQKDPEVENIHNGISLNKHFQVTKVEDPKTKTRPTETIYHCPHCTCDMRDHTWGWCKNDLKSFCKSKIGAGCTSDLSYIPICADCGHYLLNSVHVVDEEHGIAFCTVCTDYCIGETQISKLIDTSKDSEEETEETESTETAKTPTVNLTLVEEISTSSDKAIENCAVLGTE